MHIIVVLFSFIFPHNL